MSPRIATLLLFATLTLCVSNALSAGCHYGHSVKTQQLNPRDHARNFRFLGDWIYEGGQIKYAPWHNDQPCEGPLCDANVPHPTPASIAPPPSQRQTTTSLACIPSATGSPTPPAYTLTISSAAAIDLYHPVPLKPPR